jgi:hypothetical protein
MAFTVHDQQFEAHLCGRPKRLYLSRVIELTLHVLSRVYCVDADRGESQRR